MERGVELVREEPEVRYFDRELVLGRDTSSVFPKAARDSAQAEFAASVGLAAPRFVTETELEELKLARGGCLEDGTVSAADKPLHEVLRENKEKKEAEFQAKWKLMKCAAERSGCRRGAYSTPQARGQQAARGGGVRVLRHSSGG
jgi:hypothetical protein